MHTAIAKWKQICRQNGIWFVLIVRTAHEMQLRLIRSFCVAIIESHECILWCGLSLFWIIIQVHAAGARNCERVHIQLWMETCVYNFIFCTRSSVHHLWLLFRGVDTNAVITGQSEWDLHQTHISSFCTSIVSHCNEWWLCEMNIVGLSLAFKVNRNLTKKIH